MKRGIHAFSGLRRMCILLFALLILTGSALAITTTKQGNIQILSTTDYTVAEGVAMTRYTVRNSAGKQSVGYMTTIDLSKGYQLLASYTGYYTAGSTAESRKSTAAKLNSGAAWAMSQTTKQGAAYETIADAAGKVVWATNGDYYNMETGMPTGYLVMEGNLIKTGGEPFFAILKDGTPVIRNAGADLSDVKEAFSGPFYLVQNGAVVYPQDGDLMPRNSVGIRPDGTVVFFEVDGREEPYSAGITVYEMACLMYEAGCETALYLDGGGSATVTARTDGALKVYNTPCDGYERPVSSTVLLVNNGEETSTTVEHQHALIYSRSNGTLSCRTCDYRVSAKEVLYSGFADDAASGRLMYLNGGEPVTGYLAVNGGHYYFDSNGLGYEGTYTMCGETVRFEDGVYVPGSNAEVILAGRAGETADFVLTTDGILYVSGTGKLYSHTTAGMEQWADVQKYITSVRIGAGITAMGTFSFAKLSNLTEVYFEDGSQMGNAPNYCFAYCPKLTAIILPDGVKTFGYRAFSGDTQLTYLYVPAGVSYFGNDVTTGSGKLVLSVAKNSRALSWAQSNNLQYVVRDTACSHSWTPWTYYRCADYQTAGYRTCTVCGMAEQRVRGTLTFTDVPADAYFADPVIWAVENGITVGTSDTTFSPYHSCTRAQMVTFLWRSAGCPEPGLTENPFVDVDASAYYYRAVLWAVENGITVGTAEDRFSPDLQCTRAQTVTFLWRLEGKPTPRTTENRFTDVTEEDYYYSAVLWAVENNVTVGTSKDTFTPAQNCTRGQIVTFLFRNTLRKS